MKHIIAIMTLALMWTTAASAATELVGHDYNGGECRLIIENFEFNPAPGQPEAWYNLKMTVRTNYQLAGNPALVIAQSHTPWTLYGKSTDNYDTIAVELKADTPLTEKSVVKYMFQTWDEERKLVQKGCRF